MKNFLLQTVTKYQSLLLGIGLSPLVLTTQATNVLAQAKQLNIEPISLQQSSETRTAKDPRQSFTDLVFSEDTELSFDSQYQFKAEILPYTPIEWDIAEIGFTPLTTIDLFTIKF